MKRSRSIIISTVCTVLVVASIALAGGPPRVLSGTAVVNAPHGTRRMGVTLVANRLTSVEQAKYLGDILAKGGQGALLAALQGRNDGQLRLGGLTFSVALVVIEPTDDGYRYLFVTPRTIHVNESTFGEGSMDFPFGVAMIEVNGFGRGEGDLHVAAALHMDTSHHLVIEDYDGIDGHFEDLRATDSGSVSTW
ncbi:MAG: hypothetical protein GXP47_13280 [Acidobacteria bacterium]|nr:hypothetical protein [Acidobacteriota bacterium]